MRILVFGATGSIGVQTIDVIKKLKYQLVGISFYKNSKKGIAIIKDTKIKHYYSPINKKLSNVNSFQELISKTKPDLIVNAIIGFAGLEVTLLAIKNKINLALANKESLVVAGKFVLSAAKKNKVQIFPIDSEHSAIYQALLGRKEQLKTIYITASGGPFYKNKDTSTVSYNQAIKHPNWNMGPKISIDSATLMNKCFEIIEAFWLFNTRNIIPIYHPESIVHSMIELKDNSIISIMSNPDMKLPIQLALSSFNSSIKSQVNPLNFSNICLHFDFIDKKKFLPIAWAQQIIKNPNNSLSIVINAANEEAIKLFERKKIRFNEIIKVINFAINKIKIIKVTSIEQVYIIDQLTRKFVHNYKK